MTNTDLEKSFKAKLRAIAKEKNQDPADLWQHLMLERFLVRLARSEYHAHFILKGAILLSTYIDIGRETRDLDFLAQKISNEIDVIQNVFDQVAKIDLHDGFLFQEVSAGELFHPHMGYPGAVVEMTAYFGKTRFKVAIDIGFGDIVEPISRLFLLTGYSKGSLFEKSVELQCYPREFIFAEKLETLVHRGALNSRMKDFHDLFSLIHSTKEDPLQNMDEVIREVFLHRKTVPNFPISFEDGEIKQLQSLWHGYLKNLRAEQKARLPAEVSQVIKIINSWLGAHTSLVL